MSTKLMYELLDVDGPHRTDLLPPSLPHQVRGDKPTNLVDNPFRLKKLVQFLLGPWARAVLMR